LRRHDRALREVRPRAAEQQRRRHRDQARQRHLLLLAEHPRDMALRDVRDFVPEHRGDLGLGFGGCQQARVHADESARAARTR
jgi:hypothetical protein